ncbi:peptide chain release factor 1 [Saezia sanguinis]|uniref:peptide chain release factor 1 n=1 Tax=Saezia sanguinis TaxID=1965230 RepID=UPI00303BF287
MKPFIRQQIERSTYRFSELEAFLSSPEVMSDIQRFRTLSQEHAGLSPLIENYRQYQQRESDLSNAHELENDPEMAELAAEEIQSAQADLERLEQEIQSLLLPKDPNDDRPVFLEIRAGTGGDESALFAGDLLRMYTRYAERQGWRVEVIGANESDLGGYKEVIIHINGHGSQPGIYGKLKFESGGHRVQRVPVTETQGRIHTSACTVAVLPEPDEATAIEINPADLRIDTYRASGAGGQHINKTDSAVRITHIPTGIVAECQDDRSQHRNKAKAMQVLQARLQEKERSERAAHEAATRKSLVGTGDRSDRIRTYNYPQGRVTDHRINLTLYKLPFIMDGDLDEIITTLQTAAGAEQLAEMEARMEA